MTVILNGCVGVLSLKSIKKKALPDNFAEQVLDLELECEKPVVAVDHVNKLVELYSVDNLAMKVGFTAVLGLGCR
jgi:hypothetical protein